MIRNILHNSMKNHYEVACAYCNKTFWRNNRQNPKHKNKHNEKVGINCRHVNEFCSKECCSAYKNKSVNVNCGWCNIDLVRTLAEFNRSKSGLCFCNHSCSASYNNTQRRRSRRSKCEKMFFELLKERYPNLDIIANDKKLLGGFEADVSIPSLKLAIEWNGVIHYKPIFGDDKLSRIRAIDLNKQLFASNNGIRLIVISDLVSTTSFVNEAFMNTVKIIDELQANIVTFSKGK